MIRSKSRLYSGKVCVNNLPVGATLAILLISTGCSVEPARTPAATPRPATTTVIAETSPSVPADTAALDYTVNVVTQAALDTVRCAPADIAANNPAISSIDSAETSALYTSHGKAERACGTLRIRLLNGQIAVLKDDTTAGGKFGLYRYVKYLTPIHSHVIHRYPYEGTGAFIIVDDSTGASRIVFGMPVASPDGKRFVVTSMEDEAGYDPGMIEIWRMVNRRPEKEFSYDTESSPWQASDPGWVDSSTVDFIKNTYTRMGEPDIVSPGRIVRSGTAWSFATPPATVANPVGVWRGSSMCTRETPSPCNDEIDVYRIARAAGGDSLSVDGRKIVDGQEVEMGVLGCHMRDVTQFSCQAPSGVWYFTVRGDSLLGELIMPDHSPYRRVRAARSTADR
jgi:hypothetical protein